MRENDPRLSNKKLLVGRGFLVYVTQTYPAMVPYLKEFHLTIVIWRGGQASKDWKLREMDDFSDSSHQSLGSLDRTRAGAHGLDLDKAVTYILVGGVNEDEAAADHWLGSNWWKAMSMHLWIGLPPPPPVSRMTSMLYST